MGAAVAGAYESITAKTRPTKVAVVILGDLYMPQKQRNGLSVPTDAPFGPKKFPVFCAILLGNGLSAAKERAWPTNRPGPSYFR